MKREEVLEYLKQNKSFLQNRFYLKNIGIFGSFARGEATKNSDIDIIIELNKDAKNIYTLKKELREFLSNKFNRDIDIARVKYLKPYFKDEILKETIFV